MAAEIISALYPSVSAITNAQLLDVSSRITAFEQLQYPNLDMRPGSVHGDNSIGPDAWRLAAAETGINGILGDLNLNNVIAGTVYSCDFVNAYLSNMGVIAQPNAVSTGTVRLLFDRTTIDAVFMAQSNAPIVIDNGTQYLFGDNNTFVGINSSDAWSYTIYPTGTPVYQQGALALAILDQDTYAVDMPVTGSMLTAVSAGASASVDTTIPGLTQALALYNFVAGNPSTTLAERAQLALSTFYASSLNTRNGSIGFVLRQFPQVAAVSPVLTGDYEMIRDTTNVLGVSDGRVDIFPKASTGLLQDTIEVELPYVTDNGENRFLGPISFPDIPILIDTIYPTDAPTVSIWNPTAAPSPQPYLLSQTTDSSKGVLGGVTRSAYEAFTLGVNMPYTDSNPQIPIRAYPSGAQYGSFTITYRFDPSTRPVSTAVTDSANAPVGVDVLAKAPVPVVISNMNVLYLRQPGTTINAGGAQTEILSTVNAFLYPQVFSMGPIVDSMVYYGALSVKELVMTASVYQSPATYYLNAGVTPPTTNAQLDAVLASDVVPVPVDVLEDYVLTSYGGTGPLVGIGVGSSVVSLPSSMTPKTRDASRFMAYGPRNLCWILDPANLNFVEVRA